MNLLRAALLSATLGILGAWASYSYATPITDDYIAQHKAGTLFADDPRLDAWRTHTTERDIVFDRIVEQEGRTSAYYHETALWDGEPREAKGVIMIYHPKGAIEGAEWASIDPAAYDLALAGQLADVASTAVGLSMGLTEANPLGLLVLPLKYGALSYSKTLPLHECINLRKLSGGFGWGAAAMNVATIAGLGPVGLVIGLAVGIGVADSVEKDAPVRCVERDVSDDYGRQLIGGRHAAAGTAVLDKIALANGRVKIVIAGGGATKTGTFHIVME